MDHRWGASDTARVPLWTSLGIQHSLRGDSRESPHTAYPRTLCFFLRAPKRSAITQSLSEQGTFSLSDEESPRRRRQQSTIDEDNDDDHRDWSEGEHRGTPGELSSLSFCQIRRWTMSTRISRRPCPATARTRFGIRCQNTALWFQTAS